LTTDKLQVSELAPPSKLARIAPINHAIVYIKIPKLFIWQLTLLNALNQQRQPLIKHGIAIRRMNAPHTWLLSQKIDSQESCPSDAERQNILWKHIREIALQARLPPAKYWRLK
jgi:hypothetical protein